MTTELQPARSGHNHPPRCCCPNAVDRVGKWHQTGDDEAHELEQCDSGCRCSGCPQHGELALVDGIRCPQCKTAIGRPHTDYCTLSPGRVWDGVLPAAPLIDMQPACAYPHLNHGDGRGCETDDCPRHSTP